MLGQPLHDLSLDAFDYQGGASLGMVGDLPEELRGGEAVPMAPQEDKLEQDLSAHAAIHGASSRGAQRSLKFSPVGGSTCRGAEVTGDAVSDGGARREKA